MPGDLGNLSLSGDLLGSILATPFKAIGRLFVRMGNSVREHLPNPFRRSTPQANHLGTTRTVTPIVVETGTPQTQTSNRKTGKSSSPTPSLPTTDSTLLSAGTESSVTTAADTTKTSTITQRSSNLPKLTPAPTSTRTSSQTPSSHIAGSSKASSSTHHTTPKSKNPFSRMFRLPRKTEGHLISTGNFIRNEKNPQQFDTLLFKGPSVTYICPKGSRLDGVYPDTTTERGSDIEMATRAPTLRLDVNFKAKNEIKLNNVQIHKTTQETKKMITNYLKTEKITFCLTKKPSCSVQYKDGSKREFSLTQLEVNQISTFKNQPAFIANLLLSHL
ncbi:MAG: hypothetical protein V4492_00405 [Chlamydiota bacterium]